jgi:hypothetical protein
VVVVVGDDSSKKFCLSEAFILSFLVLLLFFLYLEQHLICLIMPQIWEIYPLGRVVHQFMNAFTDHRDSEVLIVR